MSQKRHTASSITDDALDELYANASKGWRRGDEWKEKATQAEATIDELSARIKTLEAVAAGNKRHVQLIVPDLERAAAAIERVRALHQPMGRGPFTICTHCSGWTGTRCDGVVTPHPCETLTALDEPKETSTT